jgi:hypothetical protein
MKAEAHFLGGGLYYLKTLINNHLSKLINDV